MQKDVCRFLYLEESNLKPNFLTYNNFLKELKPKDMGKLNIFCHESYHRSQNCYEVKFVKEILLQIRD